jgi:hypothetical protein
MAKRQEKKRFNPETFMAALNGGGTVSPMAKGKLSFPKEPRRTPSFTSKTER